MSEERVDIPIWFIKFLGWASCLFLGFFFAWAGWMSIQVVDMRGEMTGLINYKQDVIELQRDMLNLINMIKMDQVDWSE